MLAENDSEQTDLSAQAGAMGPTPSACCANDGEGAETWLARRAGLKAKHINGNGAGIPLAIAVQAPEECVPAASTSSSAGPLVSQLRRLVSAVATGTTAGSGVRLCASLETSSRYGPYWRTPQASLAFDTLEGSRPLDEYSTSYPRWGTVSAGASGVPVMSALRTSASASSSWGDEQTQWSTPRVAMASMYAEDDLTFDGRGKETRETLARQAAQSASAWPTPTVPNGGRSPKGGMSATGMTPEGIKRQVDLGHHVHNVEQGLWATPTSQNAKHDGAATPWESPHRPAHLHVQATAWPSPRASDGAKGGPNQSGSKGDLMLPSAAAQQESARPTPAARDWRSGTGAQQREGHAQPLPERVGGQLSARWVSLLMGLPADYLDIPPLPGRAGRRVRAVARKTMSPPD